MRPSSFHRYPTHTFSKKILHRGGGKEECKHRPWWFCAPSLWALHYILWPSYIFTRLVMLLSCLCNEISLKTPKQNVWWTSDNWTVGNSWRLALPEGTKVLGSSPRLHLMRFFICSLSKWVIDTHIFIQSYNDWYLKWRGDSWGLRPQFVRSHMLTRKIVLGLSYIRR